MTSTPVDPRKPARASVRRGIGLVAALAAASTFGLAACASTKTSAPVTTPATSAPATVPVTTAVHPAAGGTNPSTTAAPTSAAAAAERARVAQLGTANNQVDSSLNELHGELSQSTNTSEPDPSN